MKVGKEPYLNTDTGHRLMVLRRCFKSPAISSTCLSCETILTDLGKDIDRYIDIHTNL